MQALRTKYGTIQAMPQNQIPVLKVSFYQTTAGTEPFTQSY
jgi:hypothetical protein